MASPGDQRRVLWRLALVGGLSLGLSACFSTGVVHAPRAQPDETAYGTEVHTLEMGLGSEGTTATGIAASTPGDTGVRKESLWRLKKGGVELEYCEASADAFCRTVPIGEERSGWGGTLIMLDPVNLGGGLMTSRAITPDVSTGSTSTTESSVGAVAIGDIKTPFTSHRGVWILTPWRDELWFCSAPDGQPGCSQAQLEVGVPSRSMEVLSVHVLQKGRDRIDAVWVSSKTQIYRCEGRAEARAPVCLQATMR